MKSFDSGDSNRDLHMLQVTRGAEFPLVTVRTRLPESDAASANINADLEIQFAGQTARYKQVPFKLETKGRDPYHGNNSGHAIRFQDRPALALDDASQERNSCACGHDVASAIGRQSPP